MYIFHVPVVTGKSNSASGLLNYLFILFYFYSRTSFSNQYCPKDEILTDSMMLLLLINNSA